MSDSPRRSFVTGATGFIGQNLCKTLVRNGHEVYGSFHSAVGRQKLLDMGVSPVELELNDAAKRDIAPNALPIVDQVFHLAGRLSGTLEEMSAINASATGNLAKYYAAQSRPPRFLYVSSVAAGGPSSETSPRTEDTPPEPVSDYGKSKLLGEQAVAKFADKLPITILRPGIVFGEGDREFVQLLSTIHLLRWCPAIGSSHQPLAFIEVQDLVQMILLAIENGEKLPSEPNFDARNWTGQGIYNAAAPDPLSLNKVRLIYSRVTGRFTHGLVLPKPVGYLIGSVAETGSRLLNVKTTLSRDKIREATASGWWVSPIKAEKHLNWQPKLSIDKTMEQFVRSKFLKTSPS